MLKTTRFLVVLVCGIAVLLLGCQQKKTDSDVIVVTDCSGAQVSLSKNISNVICIDQSFCAFMTGMGLSDKLVGVHGSVIYHAWSPEFNSIYSKMKKYGYRPSSEAIYEANADLVVLNDAKYAEELRALGIPAIYFGYTNYEELCSAVDLIGEIFGESAAEYIDNWKNELFSTIESVTKAVKNIPENEKANVYYINGSTDGGLYNTFGKDSFVEFWLETIGARLITSNYSNVADFNAEELLLLNPDTIIISGYIEHTYKDQILQDPLWSNIAAVNNNRIFTMPTSFTSYERFAVELPLMIGYSANKLYPNLYTFGGIAKVRSFYQEFYGKDFSDVQYEYMLQGLGPNGERMD